MYYNRLRKRKFYAGGGSTTINTVGQIGTTALSTVSLAIKDAKSPKEQAEKDMANEKANANFISDASNFKESAAGFLSLNPYDEKTLSDYYLGNGSTAMKAAAAGISGFASGGPNILTSIGSALGNAVISLIGSHKLKSNARKAVEEVNDFLHALFNHQVGVQTAKADELSDENLINDMVTSRYADTNITAYGGPLYAFGGNVGINGGDFSTGMVHINTGDTHENNPYEGVPMGTDELGTPNLVEEGETVYNDYVFSNRLRVPKQDIKKGQKATQEQRVLKRYAGMTYADAAKKAEHNSGVDERPNDSIAKQGFELVLLILADSQEKEREVLKLEEQEGDLEQQKQAIRNMSSEEFNQMKQQQELQALLEQMQLQGLEQPSPEEIAAMQQLALMQGNPQDSQPSPEQIAAMQLMAAQQGGSLMAYGGYFANGGLMSPEQLLALLEQAQLQLADQQLVDQQLAIALLRQLQDLTTELPQTEEAPKQELTGIDSGTPADEMSTSLLNETIDLIYQWAKANGEKELAKRARKAKRASREAKEDFVDEAMEDIDSIELLKSANQNQQLAQEEVNPLELSLLALMAQLQLDLQAQQQSAEQAAALELNAQMQGGQQFAYGGNMRANFFDDGGSKKKQLDASMARIKLLASAFVYKYYGLDPNSEEGKDLINKLTAATWQYSGGNNKVLNAKDEMLTANMFLAAEDYNGLLNSLLPIMLDTFLNDYNKAQEYKEKTETTVLDEPVVTPPKYKLLVKFADGTTKDIEVPGTELGLKDLESQLSTTSVGKSLNFNTLKDLSNKARTLYISLEHNPSDPITFFYLEPAPAKELPHVNPIALKEANKLYGEYPTNAKTIREKLNYLTLRSLELEKSPSDKALSGENLRRKRESLAMDLYEMELDHKYSNAQRYFKVDDLTPEQFKNLSDISRNISVPEKLSLTLPDDYDYTKVKGYVAPKTEYDYSKFYDTKGNEISAEKARDAFKDMDLNAFNEYYNNNYKKFYDLFKADLDKQSASALKRLRAIGNDNNKYKTLINEDGTIAGKDATERATNLKTILETFAKNTDDYSKGSSAWGAHYLMPGLIVTPETKIQYAIAGKDSDGNETLTNVYGYDPEDAAVNGYYSWNPKDIVTTKNEDGTSTITRKLTPIAQDSYYVKDKYGVTRPISKEEAEKLGKELLLETQDKDTSSTLPGITGSNYIYAEKPEDLVKQREFPIGKDYAGLADIGASLGALAYEAFKKKDTSALDALRDFRNHLTAPNIESKVSNNRLRYTPTDWALPALAEAQLGATTAAGLTRLNPSRAGLANYLLTTNQLTAKNISDLAVKGAEADAQKAASIFGANQSADNNDYNRLLQASQARASHMDLLYNTSYQALKDIAQLDYQLDKDRSEAMSGNITSALKALHNMLDNNLANRLVAYLLDSGYIPGAGIVVGGNPYYYNNNKKTGVAQLGANGGRLRIMRNRGLGF